MKLMILSLAGISVLLVSGSGAMATEVVVPNTQQVIKVEYGENPRWTCEVQTEGPDCRPDPDGLGTYCDYSSYHAWTVAKVQLGNDEFEFDTYDQCTEARGVWRNRKRTGIRTALFSVNYGAEKIGRVLKVEFQK